MAGGAIATASDEFLKEFQGRALDAGRLEGSAVGSMAVSVICLLWWLT